MDFIKRLLNSRLISRSFQLPSARTLKVFAVVMAAITSATSLYVIVSTLLDGLAGGDGTSTAFLHAIGAGAANVFVCALLTLMILIMWGLYYRIVMDFCRGFVRFINWAPGAWYRFLYRLQAIFRFIIALPGILWDLGVRFLGAIGRFFNWIGSIPARWRNLTGKEKSGVVFRITFIGVYFGTFVAMYPIARKLSAAAPSWMFMSDAPFLQTLMIDLVVGSFTAMLLVTFLAFIASALRHARKR